MAASPTIYRLKVWLLEIEPLIWAFDCDAVNRNLCRKSLDKGDRKTIGYDIETVEFGWPLGMTVCRFLGDGIYEVRTDLEQNRIARVLFYIDKLGRMVLLHGFIKKSRQTPQGDLELA